MDPQTHQRLLELIYDLLPPAEAAELRRRIDTEEELARAYAQAQETAELFSQAARHQVAKIELKRPEETMSTSPEPSSQSAPRPTPRKTGGPAAVPWARAVNWTVGLAAAALLIAWLGGHVGRWGQFDRIVAGHMRLRVSGPSTVQAGVPVKYTVQSTTITGEPLPADVKYAVYSAGGQQPKWHNQTTDEDGRFEITLGRQPLPADAVLKVVAQCEQPQQTEQFQTRLQVEPARYATQLALDKPLYRPGETVFYRSLTLTRFGLAANGDPANGDPGEGDPGEGDFAVRFEILDPSGAVVSDSMVEGVTDRGVGNGRFEIPAARDFPGGEYTLVARSLDESFPEARRKFFIRRYRLPGLKKELEFVRDSFAPGDEVVADFLAERAEGGPAADAELRIRVTVDGRPVFKQDDVRTDAAGAFQVKFKLPELIERGDGQLAVIIDDGARRETAAKTIPINLGKVEVDFFPEGGDLVAGLSNRVYFAGRDPLGEPVHIRGTLVNGNGSQILEVETVHEGMGCFRFVPQAGEQYSLKIADVDTRPELPKVTSGRPAVFSTGTGVFDAGAPLEFNVPAIESGVPLVVEAWCRGAPVGQQALVTRAEKDPDDGPNTVVIPLADEVGGVIRLTIYDYRASPPVPVAERLVYRRMARRLKIDAGGQSDRYAPGDQVKMSLLVTDEADRPVPAVLGVSVVDDALLNLADDDTPGITTHFLISGEVQSPEDLEDADFYLSDDPQAAVALDLLLGTQGWRRFARRTLDELKQQGEDDPRITRLAALGATGGPPVMFDNLQDIQSQYNKDLAEYRQQRTETLSTLNALGLTVAVALILLVAMLGLLKLVSGIHLWAPAVAAAGCCVVFAATLRPHTSDRPHDNALVAFRTFNLQPPVDETDSTDDDPAKDADGRETAEVARMPVNEIWAVPDEPLADELLPPGEEPPGGKPLALWEEEAHVELKVFADLPDDAMPMRLIPMGPKEVADLREMLDEASLEDLALLGRQLRPPQLRPEMHRKLIERLRQHRFVVREYRHTLRRMPGKPEVRCDFAETLYWNPMLIADAEGRAEVSFQLCDSAPRMFRLRANAHGAGRIGSGDSQVTSRIPFSLEPKLPLQVTAGDRIEMPLAVVNDTAAKLPVELTIKHGELVSLGGPPERRLVLGGGERRREHFALEVTGRRGDCELHVSGTAAGTGGKLQDSVLHKLEVVPPGFPKSVSHSGRIDGPQEVVVELPDYWVPGSLEVTVSAFPSTLAELQKGMESILREPNGCFEQASTSNYPNVLSLQYMQQHQVANPAVTRRAKDLLKKGYVKLVGYECSQQGYEWFGGDPGHEALTAYGLMEFRDMAEVYDVDPEMIQRTAKWLMDRRDGKGGFKRNSRALDSFGGAPEDITNAYVTWALSESGQQGIDAEIEHVVRLAEVSDDPYVIALAAAGAMGGGQEQRARKLMQKLADAQAEEGHLEGKNGSITRSGGHSLKVETTALAALAWLKIPDFTRQADRAIEWIGRARQGSGGFGSTQATILALKALVEHSKAARKTPAAGTLIIKRDELKIGRHAFAAGRQETIVVDGLEANLQPGPNRLSIELAGDNQMPYAVDVSFRTRKPDSHPDCPVRLTTSLAADTVKANETVALTAELANTSREDGQPMTIAILGLPAGLQPRPDQLQQLTDAGTVDYYETRARQVICYWRALAPKQQISFTLDLVAAVPGSYTGPASRAYLYYTSEQKQWCDPLQVSITR